MCDYRRARCIRCGNKFLVEKGKEGKGKCPECGTTYFTYSIVVKPMGYAFGKAWVQAGLS